MSGSIYHNENHFYSNRIFRETLKCVEESKGTFSLPLLFSPTKLVYLLLIKLYFLVNGNPFKIAKEKFFNATEDVLEVMPTCTICSDSNSDSLCNVQENLSKSRAMFELTSYLVRKKWVMKILVFEEHEDYIVLIVDKYVKNQIRALLPDLVFDENFLKVENLEVFQGRLNKLISHEITFDNT